MKYIAGRKEEDGSIYVDKYFFDRYSDEDLNKYRYTKISVAEDFVISDLNDDLTFSYDKYNSRKAKEHQAKYESLVVEKIRRNYTIDQELALLRQRDVKTEEFYNYNTYVELCKTEAKQELGGYYGI